MDAWFTQIVIDLAKILAYKIELIFYHEYYQDKKSKSNLFNLELIQIKQKNFFLTF